jgi:hypothetical protein
LALITATFDSVVDKLLAFINLSSGAHDPFFFQSLNSLFEHQAIQSPPDTTPLHRQVHRLLTNRLAELARSSPTFADSQQAQAALTLCFDHLLPAYREFHGDVLFHQSDDFLFNAFFVGRVIETLLQSGHFQLEPQAAVPLLIKKLNDYVGHRPVAVLENRKCEPYPHEWIRPVPVFIQGVGAVSGRYQNLVEGAIAILKSSPPQLLLQAEFDPDQLAELAIDPRSLDFDHPVNRRPNHHFGQWDEHSVDGKGHYRRFIVHQITLDAMLSRVDETPDLLQQELLFEASSVLACTMLMGSGISGRGPGAYDSNMTLAKLVPVIAGYRDEFYNDLIQKLPEHHRTRLSLEANDRHQPFGAARQDINSRLSVQRDRQLIHCRLAQVYAGMGYREAALAEAAVVPVAAARINAQMDCLLGTARGQIIEGELDKAAETLPQIFSLLKRGIECGAIVDPWNIIGFDGNYSLFPAVENSIRDHRVDDLVELINQIFSVYSELWTGAAAANQLVLCKQIREQFLGFVEWWRQFATHEVMSVDAVDPQDVFEAAQHVAEALNLWHRGGAATGNLEFWAQHARMFDSPSAYRLVIEALLDRKDFNTSSALMVHWLSQSERIELQQGESSFYDLLWRWVAEQRTVTSSADATVADEAWTRIRKLYDYMEANAEQYWQIPTFMVGHRATPPPNDDNDDEAEDAIDETDDILRAAYDDVTYEDETDDGFEGNVYEGGDVDEADLEAEVDRVVDRLSFIGAIADYWCESTMCPLLPSESRHSPLVEERKKSLRQRREIFDNWLGQAILNRERLFELLSSVHNYSLPVVGVDSESMVSYDRHRLYKESLTQQIITCCVQVENSIRMLGAAILAIDHLNDRCSFDLVDSRLQNARPIVSVYAAIFLQRSDAIVELFPRVHDYLQKCRLLYVPLSRGGSPQEIVQFRTDQSSIRDLLGTLPFLGLLTETFELTKTAMTMERNMPIDQGAVTEFDELFRVAYSAMVETLVEAAHQKAQKESTKKKNGKRTKAQVELDNEQLFKCTEDLTEAMLLIWLDHSRTLRLSVLERVLKSSYWLPLVKFIKTYGSDLFTQEFLQLSNIRAILHQGVDDWLYKMQRSDLPERPRLIDEIGKTITLRQAVEFLTLILEAIIENYPRYRDYNATTTQSDHGDMLYVLLDFLRLERRYDRIAWHLKPVVWAHEILVQKGAADVARDWRRSLADRVGTEANRYLSMLKRLRKKYSVQMASIGQHLEGRFVKPMLIARLVALVPDAFARSGNPRREDVFDVLKFECDLMAAMSPGVGMDIPDWLAALEDEVDKLTLPPRLVQDLVNVGPLAKPIELDWNNLIRQLEAFPRHRLGLSDSEDDSAKE